MLLIDKNSGQKVEVLYMSELFNLNREELQGRYQVGEEILVTDIFRKTDLQFESGEPLPKCWLG